MKRFNNIAITLSVLIGMSHALLAQSGNVVFYNAGGSKLGKALTKAFNKHYPNIAVDLISAGSVCTIFADTQKDILQGVADPRRVGYAVG